MVMHASSNPVVHCRESNPQPVDYKSDAVITTLPSSSNSNSMRDLEYCSLVVAVDAYV